MMPSADTCEIDFEKALLDPASLFRRPDEVARADLELRQKIEILCRWAYDAAELAVAEEEGMGGGEPSDLEGVLNTLERITGGFDAEHTGPTKHGGLCAPETSKSI